MFCYLSDLEISRDLSYKDEIENLFFLQKCIYFHFIASLLHIIGRK